MKFTQEAISEFAATLQSQLEQKNFVQLISCLHAAKIGADEFNQAVESGNQSGEIDLEKVSKSLAEFAAQRLQAEKFHNSVLGSPVRQALLDAYDVLCASWLDQLSQLIVFYDVNMDTIQKYKAVLIAKSRQTITRDKWGDANFDDWIKVMIEFSREKFIGPDGSDLFDISPPEVKNHFHEIQANDLAARFLSQVLDQEISRDRTSFGIPKAQSTSEVGVAFEKKIKNIIEHAAPTAIVELTPATGDQGADLIVYGRNRKIVIQAKYYAHPVGNAAVQEVFAAKSFYSGTAAVVITNSTFTQSAKDLAAQLEVALLHEDDVSQLFAAAFSK